MAYTFSGSVTETVTSGTTVSATMSIGASANQCVFVGLVQNGGTVVASPTLTVGGVSLTLANNDTSTSTYLYYGQITGGLSGNQTVTWSPGSGILFTPVGFALWYAPGSAVSLGSTMSIPGTAQTGTLTVTSGEFQFGIFMISGTTQAALNLASSTQTISQNNITNFTADSGGVLANSGDCTISSTGTFTISNLGASPAVDIFCSAGAFTVTSTAAPVVTGQSISLSSQVPVSTSIGTISATNSPTAWAITAGDPAGDFSINASGVIVNVNTLNGFSSETLTVQATNSGGSGTGAVIVAWAPSINAISTASQNTSATTQIFNNVNFGTATNDRIVYLVVGEFSNGSAHSLLSASIGGVLATRANRVGGTAPGNQDRFHECWYANVVTGSVGSVVLTAATGHLFRTAISCYACTGVGTSPPTIFSNGLFLYPTASFGDPVVIPLITVYPGGFGIASYFSDTLFTVTWNSPSSGDFSVNTGTGLGSFSSCQIITAHFSTSLAPSQSGLNGAGDIVGIGISFAPSNIPAPTPYPEVPFIGPILAT